MDSKETSIIISEFLKINKQEKQFLFESIGRLMGLSPIAIEKDWWITAILRCIFTLDYGESIQFKGGTSLSKCWGMIDRLSEDIDLAVNRSYLGFEGELSKNQVSNRLRRASKSFILGQFMDDLKRMIPQVGIPLEMLEISNNDNGIPTQDPVQIHIKYPSVYEQDDYLLPQVMLEITGRSFEEALSKASVKSMVDAYIPNKELSIPSFDVTVVEPRRTFIEKVCLLHEEFNKSHGEIRNQRMSRHLYDLYMMSERGIDKEVMASEELFKDIISHRFIYNRVDGVDYNTERPGTFAIIPPGENLRLWERDYRNTIEKMVYGENRPDFETIITRIRQLNEDLNRMEWKDVPVFVANK